MTTCVYIKYIAGFKMIWNAPLKNIIMKIYFIINYLKDYVIWHWTFKGRHLLIFPLLGGTSLKPHLHWDKFMCAFNFSWSTQSKCLFVHQFIYSTVSWRKTIILSLGYLGVLSWWSKCAKLFSDLSLSPSCFRMFLHIYTYCFFFMLLFFWRTIQLLYINFFVDVVGITLGVYH